jgi:hypothetical protein
MSAGRHAVGLAAAAAAAADSGPGAASSQDADGGAPAAAAGQRAESFSVGPGCEKHIPAYATDAQRRYLREHIQVREAGAAGCRSLNSSPFDV